MSNSNDNNRKRINGDNDYDKRNSRNSYITSDSDCNVQLIETIFMDNVATYPIFITISVPLLGM